LAHRFYCSGGMNFEQMHVRGLEDKGMYPGSLKHYIAGSIKKLRNSTRNTILSRSRKSERCAKAHPIKRKDYSLSFCTAGFAFNAAAIIPKPAASKPNITNVLNRLVERK
jgi:hypothetical protein